MSGIRRIFVVVFTAALAVGCEFRPLVEPGNTHYVRVYLDEHIKNTTEGFYNPDHVRPEYDRPSVMKVTLGDRSSGTVIAERYLRGEGDDARGHYYDGYIICDPGEWSLLSWNFGTSSTQVSDQADQRAAKAFTNRIASHLMGCLPSRLNRKQDEGTKSDDTAKPEKIVYEPDHLFVARCEDVSIPYTGRIDTLRTPEGDYFTAGTIVESWYIQVNVKGMKYVSSAVALITGLSGSKTLFSSRIDEDDEVTDFFEMVTGERTDDDDAGVIYATFNTFGKIPDIKSGFEVTFEFTTNYGKAVSATIDITDEFKKELALEHRWIILDKVIEIPKPPAGTGGFAPGVDDWNDVNTDLII